MSSISFYIIIFFLKTSSSWHIQQFIHVYLTKFYSFCSLVFSFCSVKIGFSLHIIFKYLLFYIPCVPIDVVIALTAVHTQEVRVWKSLTILIDSESKLWINSFPVCPSGGGGCPGGGAARGGPAGHRDMDAEHQSLHLWLWISWFTYTYPHRHLTCPANLTATSTSGSPTELHARWGLLDWLVVPCLSHTQECWMSFICFESHVVSPIPGQYVFYKWDTHSPKHNFTEGQ